jgi:mRNA interferase MazF
MTKAGVKWKRGSLVTAAPPGDYGKPRPALVVQSDIFSEHPSVTVLLISSERVNAPLLRIDVAPSPENGLAKRSQIMIDKPHTLRREKIGKVFGQIEEETQIAVNRALAIFLGLA